MLTHQNRRRRPPPRDTWRLEVDAELGRQVRELAFREHRTLTSQVQLLLRRALATEKTVAA